MKRQLIFVIGAAAAGKSYFIQRYFQDKKVEILDDAISKLSAGLDVVVEHTLYKAKRRIAYMDEIRKLPDVKVVFYVMQPTEARWKSNRKQRGMDDSIESLRETVKEIEFPNPAEGIDEIYAVVDDEIILRTDAPTPEIIEPAWEELRKEQKELAGKEGERKKREELLESMKQRKFWHYCEVCGKKELLTSEEGFEKGWDYPPRMGFFGLLGPRTCGNCGITDTLFWKVQKQGIPIVIERNLSPEEIEVWERIKGEPESLLDGAPDVCGGEEDSNT